MPKDAEVNLTLPQLFSQRAASYGSRPALFTKDKFTKTFRPITWRAWSQTVAETALGLFSLGVRRGDKVAILSENRPEWTYADLGILSLGAVSVPIYPTSSPLDVAYILENAEAQILFISTSEQFERLAETLKKLPLKYVICFDCFLSQGILTMEDLAQRGRQETAKDPGLYKKLLETGDPSDTATLIYTSGTTGPPKGVMLSHSNFVANYIGSKEFIKITARDSALSFLPLSHVFERLAGYYFMAFHGATISYAENMQTVAEDIQIVKPTVCAAVPRFYEKVYAKIIENVEKGSPFKRTIFKWAVSIGQRKAACDFRKERRGFLLSIAYFFAKLLVFNKIKKKMGGRLRFFISGGAPLSKELAEFFYAADVLILEGYGLTETSPVIAVNAADDFCFGTVGRPLKNIEVKIAPDGEILTKGPCVMQGYYRNPQATAEVLQDGWFHTGDIGEMTPSGFLKITDRKKDIIATSGGKKVAPQNIERLICSDALFMQAVILGDKRNYLTALIVPNRMLVEKQAHEMNLSLSYEELLKHPLILEWIESRFRQKTASLASYEQIKYYALLPNEFTQESGELTPTMKYKRKLIVERHKEIIESLYQRKSAESASTP